MERVEWLEELNRFREYVDETAKEKHDPKDLEEFFEDWEKKSDEEKNSMNLNVALPFFHLCKSLRKIADSKLVRHLLAMSAQAGLDLRETPFDWVRGNCLHIATEWSIRGDADSLEIGFTYSAGDIWTQNPAEEVRLITAAKGTTAYMIKNVRLDQTRDGIYGLLDAIEGRKK